MRMTAALAAAACMATIAIAGPADAAVTSDIAGGGNIVMTGDGADDLVVIKTSGGLLAYSVNGGANQTDWDTVQGGVQTVSSGAIIFVTFNGGEGDDIVVVGGNGGSAASVLSQDYIVNGGGGFDAMKIDASDDVAGRNVTFNASSGTGTIAFAGGAADGDYQHSDVEVVVADLGSGPDTVSAPATDTTHTVGADGNGGTDTATVGGATGLSTIEGRFDFDGGAGTSDSLTVTDAASPFPGGTYVVSPQTTKRVGGGDVTEDQTVEQTTFTATSGPDAILKTGGKPTTINAGAGDDLVSVRDSIGDTANCGDGNDFVVTDPLDVLSGCESSDRPTAGGGGGGGGGNPDPGAMTSMTGSMATMATDMSDRTAPTAAVSGLPSSVKVKTLLKGLKGMVAADERCSYEVALLGSTSRATLARTYNLTLASQTLPLDMGARNIKLKPSKRLVGKASKFSVRVVVTPTDAAGNRGKPVVKTLKVKR